MGRAEHAVFSLPPPPRLRVADIALFLDVDGTLLEIEREPGAVHVPERLCRLLEHLQRATRGALALVSGRSLDQLDRLFSPLRFSAAGLHGLERRNLGRRTVRAARGPRSAGEGTPAPRCLRRGQRGRPARGQGAHARAPLPQRSGGGVRRHRGRRAGGRRERGRPGPVARQDGVRAQTARHGQGEGDRGFSGGAAVRRAASGLRRRRPDRRGRLRHDQCAGRHLGPDRRMAGRPRPSSATAMSQRVQTWLLELLEVEAA